ncbi:hypothetical protein CCAND95_10021 [Capnocytophaga canis]|uniref:Uncharacterized protein n=1 Tax=Capnocytophaga canis TaxID=1848903 RepID=A0A0B7HXS7_9FLAO|nr:hypothetical protein CCAND95_10021 [Capnocytophaga canis]CEN43061.1 hypothetical protein CCAND38_10020 [Capnocytophaga canis]
MFPAGLFCVIQWAIENWEQINHYYFEKYIFYEIQKNIIEIKWRSSDGKPSVWH